MKICIFLCIFFVMLLPVKTQAASKFCFKNITATKSSVTLNWSKDRYSKKYTIYRKKSGQSYKKIATVNSSTFTYKDTSVKAGNSYYYLIKSYHGNFLKTCKSGKVKVTVISAPKTVVLASFLKNDKVTNYFRFNSVSGYTYQILRKTASSNYKIIASVKASSSIYTYKDRNLDKNTRYIYTVRRYIKSSNVTRLGNSASGLKTFTDYPADVTTDITNMYADISWSEVSGVDGYQVIRKFSKTGTCKIIAEIDNPSETSYRDIYYQTFDTSDEVSNLYQTYFIDPSKNNLCYSVRAYKEVNGRRIYTSYLPDGYFSLYEPTIDSVSVSGKNVTIDFATVPNAEKYYIYSSANGTSSFSLLGTANQTTKARINVTLPLSNTKHKYFTVRAVSTRNGKTIKSTYDKNFTISKRKYSDKNVLFIGDSINFGTPYINSSTKDVFSFPYRINQLTGVTYYNPSIPSATITENDTNPYCTNYNSGSAMRDRLLSQVIVPLVSGEQMWLREGSGKTYALRDNPGMTFKNFDVIVLEAGTNDYTDNAPLGDLDSTNVEEFNGAYNKVFNYIKTANKKRTASGKSTVKVVWINLFYRNLNTSSMAVPENCATVPNQLGLTLQDYQDDIDELITKYSEEGIDIYQFDSSDIVNETNCQYVTADNLHMTKGTYSKIGNALSQFMIDNGILD